MKTQVSVTVKNESFLSRMYSFLWFINIFKKMSVAVIIDGDTEHPHILQARKEPYLLDVTPGQHEILFTDPRAASKSAYKKFANLTYGVIGSIATGGAIGVDDFSSGETVRDNYIQCTLNEGDVLRVSAKPKHNGSVKVKILKK